MIGVALIVFSVSATALSTEVPVFPAHFKFGAATAAYQIEGAWNVSGKTMSVWDVFTHNEQHRILDGSNGDVACDSYHLWRRDIEMISELGLDFYRFSISWPRICPNGLCNVIGQDGVRYYNNLINGLLEKGIEPVITIYHWDIPQRLQDLGAWTNPLVVEWFADYARVLFNLFGDRVKTWITINEPLILCDAVYGDMEAPHFVDPYYGAYLCGRHVLLAHATVWRMYDEEFKPKYHGKLSLSNQLVWYEPETEEDAELAELANQHGAGRYSHAIFSQEGGWPPTLEKHIAELSKKQGYSKSRLPPFSKDEIEFMKGTYDFYAFNFYTSKVVRRAKPGEKIGYWPLVGSEDLGVVLGSRPEWKKTTSWWFSANAKGLRDQLNWLKKEYGPLKFMITENGMPSNVSNLNDTDRVEFFESYLSQLLLAIKEDDIDVTGYTIWSLMDNFEWRDGYTNKFGIYEVNFTDPMRTRTPRSSAHYYAKVVASRAPPSAEIVETTVNTSRASHSLVLWIALGLAVGLIALGLFMFYRNKLRKREQAKYANVAVTEEGKMKTPFTQ